ncbi:hypothetical protein MQC88_10140 [Luteimonas sp. 50]|uniref:Uncharacterized protein n=1 Tax=Cognatiluteimonas sedimenti TaxID=2927791 RepID=A0ABT0A5Q3_9GAMM|nr:hypothetical protein [Lysobacter sedimenti]MCJ0826304.1 hypothetical protein [Lysobacter sedimenti]
MLLKPVALLTAAVLLLVGAVLLPHLVAVPPMARGILLGLGGGLLFAAFLRWRLPDGCDSSTLAVRRRYLRDFVPAMGGYIVLLFASMWLLKRVDEPALRALVALLPVPPIALMLRAIVRFIRDADELQRQIELEAVSLATALVSLLYMAGGFLQLARVIDVPAGVAMIWMFPLVCLVYGLAKIAVVRRFR